MECLSGCNISNVDDMHWRSKTSLLRNILEASKAAQVRKEGLLSPVISNSPNTIDIDNKRESEKPIFTSTNPFSTNETRHSSRVPNVWCGTSWTELHTRDWRARSRKSTGPGMCIERGYRIHERSSQVGVRTHIWIFTSRLLHIVRLSTFTTC